MKTTELKSSKLDLDALPVDALIEIADAAYVYGKNMAAQGNTDPRLKRALASLRLQLAVSKELRLKGAH